MRDYKNRAKAVSMLIIIPFAILFVYIIYKAIIITNKRDIFIDDGIYHNYVTTSPYISQKADEIISKCSTTDRLCMVQSLLDFVSVIPYQTKTYQQLRPIETIEKNYGDCDDKSNLLISLLHSLNMEAYFVLIPKHIFVIVPVNDDRLTDTKGLWINGKKYYILESTIPNSKVGYEPHTPTYDIEGILEPFTNEKMDIDPKQITFSK